MLGWVFLGVNANILQPRFPWNKGISLSQLPCRSCEVAKIWPEYWPWSCQMIWIYSKPVSIKTASHSTYSWMWMKNALKVGLLKLMLFLMNFVYQTFQEEETCFARQCCAERLVNTTYIKTLILRFFFGRRLTFRWWENDLNHWPICSTDVTANLPFRGSKIVTNALMKWPSQSYQQNHDVETSISTTPQQELWISKNDLERIFQNHSIMAILRTVPI